MGDLLVCSAVAMVQNVDYFVSLQSHPESTGTDLTNQIRHLNQLNQSNSAEFNQIQSNQTKQINLVGCSDSRG